MHNLNNNNTLVLEGYMKTTTKNQCPGLKFPLIPKLISWVGIKPKKLKTT